MNRTDIHSPTNFEPADYTYVGSFDNWPEPGAFLSHAPAQDFETDFGKVEGAFTWEHAQYLGGRRLLTAEGAHVHFDPERGEEQCDHCGARIRYVTLYRHKSGVVIAVGDTCAQERFGQTDRRAYDIKRLKQLAADARERAKTMGAAVTFLEANAPELVEWTLSPAAETVHPIFADISRKLVRYGSVSPAQIGFCRRLLREHMERQRNGGKTDAELAREAERAAAPDCPEGRYEITGEVLKVAEHESDFGIDWKMTVKDDRGFVVWMTVPGNLDVTRGDRVAVTATVSRSDRDPKFGFGKRPSKARLLNPPPVPQRR